MKKKKWLKWLLIILMVGFVFSIAIPVLAKVSFGNWDKWDEELPPADNKSWYWAVSESKPYKFTLRGAGESGSDVILLFSEIYFYETKDGKTRASVVFYSQNVRGDIKNWDIPNADIAIVTFPPNKKNIMIVRAYKMEDKIFKFYEEWEILFEKHEGVYEDVVPEDAKFRQIFQAWLGENISFEKIITEELIDLLLPKLLIIDKISGTFMILPAIPNQKM